MKTTGAKDITKICGFLFALSVSSSCGKADYRALSSGQQANNNVPGDSNPPPTAPPPPTEDPERFHTKGSGGQKGNTNQTCQGGRSFRLLVPQSYAPANASPIVVAIYGLGDDFQNFDATIKAGGWHQTAEKKNIILMTPEDGNSERDSFLHLIGSNQLDEPATKTEISDIIECIYYSIGAKYNIDTERIHFIGMSEGAVFAGYVGLVSSEQVKSVALYAGAIGHRSNLPRLLPAFFLTGTADFSFDAIQDVVQDWKSAGHTVKEVYPSGVGHSFLGLSAQVTSDTVWTWLDNATADSPVKSTYKQK
jgi:poly(3-hydroxybutyrate) depolymerase